MPVGQAREVCSVPAIMAKRPSALRRADCGSFCARRASMPSTRCSTPSVYASLVTSVQRPISPHRAVRALGAQLVGDDSGDEIVLGREVGAEGAVGWSHVCHERGDPRAVDAVPLESAAGSLHDPSRCRLLVALCHIAPNAPPLRAPRSRPIGECRRVGSSSCMPISQSLRSRSSWVQREPIAPMRAADSRGARLQEGYVALGVDVVGLGKA